MLCSSHSLICLQVCVFLERVEYTVNRIMTTNVSFCDFENSTADFLSVKNNSDHVVGYNVLQIKLRCDLANAAILILVMPFILAGNIMVVTAVIKFQRLRTAMNMFIASLAVSDILVACPSIPLYVAYFVKGEVLKKFKYLCLSRYSSVVASMSGSIISLTFISFDRYVAVIHPLHHQTMMTKRRVKYMLLGIWTYDIAFSIMPLAGVNVWQPGMPCQFFRILPKPYTAFTVPVVMAVCLSLSIGMYIIVFRAAKRHQARMRRLNVNSAKRKIDNRRQIEKDTRNAKIMAFVLLLFVIFWFPFLATSLLKYLPFSQDVFEIAKTFAVTIAMTNSVVNPIIYCWLRKDFQKAFRHLLCRKAALKHRSAPCQKFLKPDVSSSLGSSDITASTETVFHA